ncbi:MAG: hypothetical protein V4760_03210 [Bdellovibrionota bacterium]
MGSLNGTRKITRTLLTGAALFLSHTKTAYAGVNVKDMDFSTTFIDLDSGHVKILRTYDSRSTFNGLFGFGWCSTLDRQLVKGPGLATSANAGERQATTSIAIDSCGKRTIFAAIGAKPTSRWNAVKANDGFIDTDKGDFVHRGPDGRELARFERTDGRLNALATERGQTVPLLREPRGSLLRDAATGEGSRVRLEVDPLANKILRIGTLDGRQRASFEYQGDDLIKVTNAWNNTYHFSYDSLHNLLETRYPDQSLEQMTYDADHDRLTSFRGRNSCIERYEISIASNSKRKKQTTTAVKSCGEKETSRVAFEFDYRKTRVDGGWRLAKLKLTREGRTMSEIDYSKGGSQ